MLKRVIGFQIVSNDGNNDIPECFFSFEMFEDIELACTWLEHEKTNPEHGEFRWVILPIFEGDIEEPTIMTAI